MDNWLNKLLNSDEDYVSLKDDVVANETKNFKNRNPEMAKMIEKIMDNPKLMKEFEEE